MTGTDTSTLAPDNPFWVVGDVHGRADLLDQILTRILPDGLPVVLVGDYVNKGPDSARVLRRLRDLSEAGQVTPLRGNHDDLFLRFLSRPLQQGRAFRRFGGGATLASFGCPTPAVDAPRRDYAALRDKIRQDNPGLHPWLQSCGHHWTSGNVTVLHAGADPALPLAEQNPLSFAWGHPRFHDMGRADGHWIVHGHGPVTEVTAIEGRIAVDTGAATNGRLSAVRIDKGALTVIGTAD